MSSLPAEPRLPNEGRLRAVVEGIAPAVDGGRFAIKRVLGEPIVVEADCFTDGHDQVAALLLWRKADARRWNAVPMRPLVNDRWRASFVPDALGSYRYTVTAWVDPFLSWRHDFGRRIDPEDVLIAALVGAELVEATAERARGAAKGDGESV
jgi:starch synthase (maltosyl-transferring)